MKSNMFLFNQQQMSKDVIVSLKCHEHAKLLLSTFLQCYESMQSRPSHYTEWIPIYCQVNKQNLVDEITTNKKSSTEIYYYKIYFSFSKFLTVCVNVDFR